MQPGIWVSLMDGRATAPKHQQEVRRDTALTLFHKFGVRIPSEIAQEEEQVRCGSMGNRNMASLFKQLRPGLKSLKSYV